MTAILIVDDDADLRAALTRELTETGHEVSATDSVRDAIDLLGDQRFDVLLTDLRMSDRDGIDLLHSVRSVAAGTRPILMSAYATIRDHDEAMRLGAVTVLAKPFTRDELLDAVRQAIDCATGFRGSVHGLSLVDLLQMFHYGRRSLSIELGGPAAGTIHMELGEIVHASLEDLRGEEALAAVLAAPRGSIRTGPARSVPHTISRSFQSLLLDLLRRLDEADEGTAPAGLADEQDWGDLFEDAAPPEGPAIDPELTGLADGLARVAPELGLLVCDGPRVTALRGELTDDAGVLDGAAAAAAMAAALDSTWTAIELVGNGVGTAVLRDRDRLLVATELLVGRYAPVKFRAHVGRVSAALSERVKGQGEHRDGKD